MRETILNKKRRLHYLYKIVNKEWDIVTFKPNKAQNLVRKMKIDLQKRFKRVRLIILKARQLGMSTFELIDWLDTVLFSENETKIITAHKQDKQKDLFQRVKFAYDSIPDEIEDPEFPWWVWKKPKPKYDNVNELYFPETNSRIKVSLDSRSNTPTGLHITELAFVENAREMMAGTLPSIPKNAPITIETTANGVGGYFHELRKKYEGMSNWEFHTVFIPRYTDDEYVSEVFRETPKELAYLHDIINEFTKDKLSQEQINRYLEQYEMLGREVFQEFPSTADEAFLTTGDNVFNTTTLKNLPKLEFRVDPLYDHLRWYRKDVKDIIVGVDTSEWNSSWDYSPIVVRDYETLDLVCALYDKFPPDALCEVIDYIRKQFHSWLIGIERNNTGVAVLQKAKEYDWHNNLYQEKTIDKLTNRQTKKPWRHTNTKTRPYLISEYEEAIRLWQITQIDERQKWEMYTFVYNEKKKPEAQEWCHDDCIIADAICLQTRKDFVPSNTQGIQPRRGAISSITRKPIQQGGNKRQGYSSITRQRR